MTTILLVEDNSDMESLLRDLLQWGGHEVLSGRTGQEGLRALMSASIMPDVIISDLNMPLMDGLGLLREVRRNPAWAHIRFIIMSANPYDDRLTEAQKDGLYGVLPKPFSLDQLNQVLG